MADERACGECSLCCKVNLVDDYTISGQHVLTKAGEWCEHAQPGCGGCAIYHTRPPACAEFQCAWLAGDMPEELKPTKAKAVVLDSAAGWLCLWCDPSYPRAWDEGKLGKHIRRIATKRPVLVIAGNFKTVLAYSQSARKQVEEIYHQGELGEEERPPIKWRR